MIRSVLNLYRRLSQDDEMSFFDFVKSLIILSRFESNYTPIQDYNPVSDKVARCIHYYWQYCEFSLGKLRFLDYPWHYWQSNDHLVINHCEIEQEDLLFSFWGNRALFPGNYAIVNHQAQAIVWCIRPTLSTEDIITDLLADSVEFMGGYAHEGMVRATENLMKEVFPRIEKALKQHPDYNLVITGHSLGGSLSTMLAIHIYPRYRVSAIAFASAPCVSLDLARGTYPYVLGVVFDDDVISRLSYHSFRWLKKRLFLIESLKQDEKGLRRMNIIEGHEWAHEAHFDDSERLWPAIRQIHLKKSRTGTVVAKEISSTCFRNIVVSSHFILDHSPYVYTNILNTWRLQTTIEA